MENSGGRLQRNQHCDNELGDPVAFEMVALKTGTEVCNRSQPADIFKATLMHQDGDNIAIRWRQSVGLQLKSADW